jgi:hypothetical protein
MTEIQPIDLNKKTVFVLGAGASKPYGFPLGSELKQSIISNLSDITQFSLSTKNKFDKNLTQKFVDALKGTSLTTIDNFLEKKTKFREIGSYAIAFTLLHYEIVTNLLPPRDWYYHIFRSLDFEKNTPSTSNITFVTLNYDRSLEYFLDKAIEYDCADELIEHSRLKLSKLKIIHPHGSLGEYPITNYSPSYSDGSILEKAAKEIRITADQIEDTLEFQEAKIAIWNASNLIFLGFGYDEKTVKRLTTNITLPNKRILGTTLYISDNTRNFINGFFGGNFQDRAIEVVDFLKIILPI